MSNATESGSSNIEVKKVPNFVLKKKLQPQQQKLIKLYHGESEVTRALCFIQGAGQDARQKAFSHEWTEFLSSLFESNEDGQYVMGKPRVISCPI